MYAALEKGLESLDPDAEAIDRYGQGILLIREKIGEMQVQAKKGITGRETEVGYFRDVWPFFFARLWLYIRVYDFELWRQGTPAEGLGDLIGREEETVAAFFRLHEEFWKYFRARSGLQDEAFTRAYSKGRIFARGSLAIDQEGSTLASWEAAECLEMEGFRLFLLREKKRLLQPSSAEGAEDYTFGGKDVQFVEWLNLQQASGAILFKGKPADLARVEKWAGFALNKRVSNIYDRTNVLRQRKRDRLRFSRWAMESLEKKFDAQDKRGG